MTIQLYAQPYEVSADGFSFESFAEYQTKASKVVNAFGQKVEEFELQVVDADRIDCEFARAVGVNQTNIHAFFTAVEEWDDHDKTVVIIAVGECGYQFEATTRADDFDVCLYHFNSYAELAEHFVWSSPLKVVHQLG